MRFYIRDQKYHFYIYSGLTARDFVEFGVSALNQPSESVRRVAERIIVALYHTHPKLVRQNLPLEEDISPKNVQYRQLFQQFDKIDKEVWYFFTSF